MENIYHSPIPRAYTIGLDRSKNLLQIAQRAGNGQILREVVCGDVLDSVWREGLFDYAISIATIHHLATPERRRRAVQRLLQSVSPKHGRILIYVWATEQDSLSKRNIPSNEGEVGEGVDVFVPWVMNQSKNGEVFNRYYHMFAEGELEGLIEDATRELGLSMGSPDGRGAKGVEMVQKGWERSNHYVELKRWVSE
ncbi:tRNA methyltransferase, has a role in tRNA modification [Paramarasmius palmivorus]|uniref:tRNA methyltransferase, has a role in tRNA modification n=1 Tax=Paramarasmius palmivorus TaxID=297713 RepID=A0AAW0DUV6_9AGAR